MSEFQGRVAAVTGAGSGIGRALALGLAQRGARLALSDFDAAGLAETVAHVQAAVPGAAVHHTRVDVADRAAVEAWAAAVAAEHGVVNQIYNNAGISTSGSVNETSYEDYERVLAVNLWGVIHGTKAFLPHLVASGDGHVVNISSLNGFMAQAGLSHYCTTKFAVRGFTESLRSEMLMGHVSVRVTCVHPGGVATNIAASSLESARARGELVTPEREAEVAEYTRRFLRMPPERAAATILAGVAADRGRVLVGNDAKAIDAIVRTFPSRYPQVVAGSWRALARRQASKN